MAGRLKMRTKWARNQKPLNDDNFWVLVFELIERGQNLPAISKAVDVPYSSMSKFINDQEGLKASFQKAKLIHRIQFPAKNITNCTFGGKNTKELYVSTATKGMGKADLRKFRYSGFFFSVKTNAKGVLQKKFILSNEEKRSLL